jgi:hypothetical protein
MPFKVGALTFPISTPTGYVLRDVVEPALSILGSLLYSAIYAELNTVYQVVDPDGYIITDFIPTNPEPYIAMEEFLSFPFIAIWRDKYTINYRTLEKKKRTSNWKIQYCLGEVDEEKEKKLFGLLNAVSAVIETTIYNSCSHSSYNDGYSQLDALGFSSIDIISSEIGIWKLIDGETYIRLPVITLQLETTEEVEQYTDFKDSAPLETIYIDTTDGYAEDPWSITKTLNENLYDI